MHSKKALLDQNHAKIIIDSYIAFYNSQRLLVPMPTSLPLVGSLAEITRYMKKGGKRVMLQDLRENKMFSEMRSN